MGQMDTKIRNHFKKVDPILYKALEWIDTIPPLKKSDKLFEDLCESIASQQLSVKASDTIFKRFKALFPNSEVTPKPILQFTIEEMRAVGLSNAKANYIKDLAQRVVDGLVELEKFDGFSNQQVIDELVAVKGIGPWTAEMYLMFTLARPDVFSLGDLGLRNAIKKLYGIETNSKAEILRLSEKWKPYRTYACRILWRSLDQK